MGFRLLVASIGNFENDFDVEIADGLFQALVSKLANTRINEVMNARIERELKDHGKVVDGDEMLRPCFNSLRFGYKTQLVSLMYLIKFYTLSFPSTNHGKYVNEKLIN